MKTTSELTKLLGCKRYQVKPIAKYAGWKSIKKRMGYIYYDITDQDIADYLAKPMEFNNHDYTLDLYKLTLGWSNLHERYLRHIQS